MLLTTQIDRTVTFEVKEKLAPFLVPVSFYIKSLMLHCTPNEKYYLTRYVKCNKILY